MEYFIPAWHEDNSDWAVAIPSITILDATSHMRILQNNGHQVGIIISTYEPGLMTRLNQLNYYPDQLFSIYDYLQGIHNLESRVVEINDFAWPKNAIFDYTPFRTIIADKDKFIAKVFYDFAGKVIRIEHHGDTPSENYTLIMDSRGFISSKNTDHEAIFYDPYGNWRFKQDRDSGVVTINPNFNFYQKTTYSNIKDLINEVLQQYLETNLKNSDHLIVTLDNDSLVDLNQLNHSNAIFMINPRQPYQEELSNLNQGNLLVSKTDLADKLEQQYPEKFSVNVILAYNSEFRLGHSSRERVQRIAFFAENANQADIEKIIKHLCKYVSHDFKNKSIQVFTYSLDKDNWVNQVIDKIKKDSKGKWIISSGDEKEKVENIEIAGLGKAKGLPQIKIKELRLTNISQLLKALDKTRVLISWGSVDVVTPEIRTQISGVLLCLN
ncbi:accessory Sec system protein Asp1 [Lactobacillus gasseri]|uniref:accessory Sec system protein Asp1 n=1 Tax=Lactobacillus gasseri TaxID=1596 RepID=UPI0021B23517|nr:accessory Sec system protein Asp1 [Lactobacillus gasseri]